MTMSSGRAIIWMKVDSEKPSRCGNGHRNAAFYAERWRTGFALRVEPRRTTWNAGVTSFSNAPSGRMHLKAVIASIDSFLATTT